MSAAWLWSAAFVVVALAAPEAFGVYWRNLKRLLVAWAVKIGRST